MSEKLTEKQTSFVREVFKPGVTPKSAALSVGYSSTPSQILGSKNVRAALSERVDSFRGKYPELKAITEAFAYWFETMKDETLPHEIRLKASKELAAMELKMIELQGLVSPNKEDLNLGGFDIEGLMAAARAMGVKPIIDVTSEVN